MNEVEDRTTPRAEINIDLTRTDVPRPQTHGQRTQPPQQQQQHHPKAQQLQQPPMVRVIHQSTPASPDPPLETAKVAPMKPIRQTRSEAPSPPIKAPVKRFSLVRNGSHYGEGKVEMPHHPLIRGQSYHGSSLRPAALAPLTVNSEAAQAHMTASPSRSGSPPYSAGIHQSPSEASTTSRIPSRKGSISSLHSVATLPAPSSRFFGGGRGNQDPRTRTMSTISNSSSSAALSALNMLPAVSRPATPPMIVHFPPESRRDASDGLHQLLPPPYAPSHLTAVAKYNPLGECYERVMRAKRGQ